jgi:hypothetical protein
MLHTFTSTAYEIADYTYSNMQDLGFVNIQDLVAVTQKWSTVELVCHDDTLDELLAVTPSLFNTGVTPVYDRRSY